MNLYLLQQYKFIQNLYKNENYLDVLMNIDDFFDILNVYVFPNWFDAEVVEMKCMKHFTNIIIKQPYKKMPHPKGGVLLSKYGCIVKYKQTSEWKPVEYHTENDITTNEVTGKKQPKMKKEKIWLVDILIPNKHIINDNVYDLESIQKKIDDNNDEDENMESVVSNGDELGNS